MRSRLEVVHRVTESRQPEASPVAWRRCSLLASACLTTSTRRSFKHSNGPDNRAALWVFSVNSPRYPLHGTHTRVGHWLVFVHNSGVVGRSHANNRLQIPTFLTTSR